MPSPSITRFSTGRPKTPPVPGTGASRRFPADLTEDPYFYCVAVAADPSSCNLLASINEFIAQFLASDERRALEEEWQGEVTASSLSYRDVGDGMLSEADLRDRWEKSRSEIRTAVEDAA